MAKSRLVDSLPGDLKASVGADLDPLQAHQGDVLQIAGQQIEYIHFPTTCLASLIVTVENGSSVEAATVGSDGFVEVAAVLGMVKSDLTAVVQIPGDLLRMRFANFQKHLADEQFRAVMGGFAAKAFATTAQSTACNAFHPVVERLARWLLMVRDSLDRDEFILTQNFIAIMLGVHRPTVTVAIRTLESAGLIEHARGMIRISDPDALVEAACECYSLSGWERSSPGTRKLIHRVSEERTGLTRDGARPRRTHQETSRN